jgi:biopolymer transport protein ExbD
MSQVTPKGTVAPKMNITPLIDVVFLLIIFFMIVSKIVSDQTVEMIVPDVGEDPQTLPVPDEGIVIVNVSPMDYDRATRTENPLQHPGDAKEVQIGDANRFALNDLAGITAFLQNEKTIRPEVEVLLRADSALYYEAVQPVMDAITGAGIETVNVVAYRPENE